MLFKAYFITQKKENTSLHNAYSPFYISKQSHPITHFLFNPSFHHILPSFPSKQINIPITYSLHLTDHFHPTTFLLQHYLTIHPTHSLQNLHIPHLFSHF
ncbi:DUF4865 family protein, partial [Bacillus altitudinis]|uniref:DUF4865 family protein n=1 Tax=Bacillus altitudinis TaxID=293387 RepID=UPI001F327531